MEGLNKFKVLTIAVVLLFLFVVAAIYTNAREASRLKMKTKANVEKANLQKNMKADMAEISDNSTDIENLNNQIQMLNQRLDETHEQMQSLTRGNCRIYGIMTENGPEELSVESSVQEAQNNGRELILTCSF